MPIRMDSIFKKLTTRKEAGNQRQLRTNEGKVDFSSNDYLGLGTNPLLAQAIDKTYHEVFATPVNGSGGSRLLAGHHAFYTTVEEYLATFFEAEAALVFNSGYVANLALLSTIPQKGDTILLDEYIHASLKDGARLSFADKFSFRHNDLNDLEHKLKKAQGNVFVVAESLYSMDGDFAPLEELLNLCERYGAFLVVDEAHTTGSFGLQGKGYLHALGIADRVPFRVYTFGKAMGIHGACIVGSSQLKEYLINFARPFIYTTAMPPHAFASVWAAFQFLEEHQEYQQRLFQLIHYWNSSVPQAHAFSRNTSPIQTFICPGNEKVRALSAFLQTKGMDVRAILSPTVKDGTERLRICLHATHTEQELHALINAITSFHV